MTWNTEDAGVLPGWVTDPDEQAEIDEIKADLMTVGTDVLRLVNPLLIKNRQLVRLAAAVIGLYMEVVHQEAYETGYDEGQANYECEEDHRSYDSGRESRDDEVTELQSRIDTQAESIETLEEEIEALKERIKDLEDQ